MRMRFGVLGLSIVVELFDAVVVLSSPSSSSSLASCSRPRSSARARRRLFRPLGGAAGARLVIFLGALPGTELLGRPRRRSLKGDESAATVSACVIGGDGSWDGGGEGASMDCSARQVEYRFEMAGCVEDAEEEVIGEGESGGEAKSMADWYRVLGRAVVAEGDEVVSQVRAEGSSMVVDVGDVV
jgi:hypothetical protein